MKLRVIHSIHFSILTLVILASCQSIYEKQVIVYISDFQWSTMHPDGTHIEPIKPNFLGNTPRWSHPKWSPDGRQMAFVVVAENDLGSIWVANSDGSEPHSVTEGFDFINAVWLDNNILITHVGTKVNDSGVFSYTNYILDLEYNTMQIYSHGPENIIPSPSGDRWLAWNEWKASLILYDISGNEFPVFPQFRPSFQTIDIAPSGREVVFCHDKIIATAIQSDGLYHTKLETRETTEPRFVYPLDDCQFVRWSPDGKHVALLDNQNNFYILDATDFSLVNTFDIGPLTSNFFVWSPDSKYVVVHKHYGEPGPGPKELARVSIEDGKVVRLTNNENVEYVTDWITIRK